MRSPIDTQADAPPPHPRRPSADAVNHAAEMDRMYLYQRHIYDLTRKYYLIGRDRLLETMVINGGDRVLEVGCGTGRNLVRLAKVYKGARFYGLDASHEMLKTSRAKVGRSGCTNRIILRQSLAEDLCFERTFDLAEPFDVIFFSYSLSMIPTWREATEAALANLKPSGSLFILDFWDGRDLPEWFSKALTKWLALYDVYYRRELLSYIQELQMQGAGKLSLTSIARRYSFLVQFQKISL